MELQGCGSDAALDFGEVRNNIRHTVDKIPVISFQDVSFSYNGQTVLEQVTFNVEERDLICIVGPNGGGKTTLLKLMLGLIKPDTGVVLVNGEPPGNSRRRIGYMPQYVHHDPQFPVTVMDIVLMGRLGQSGLHGFFGWRTKTDRASALDALRRVGMEGYRDHPISELSGGQRQRVLIARALASEPELLLLDEPTANVDALAESRFIEILKELNLRMTILMVSHDLGFVSDVVERVICVNQRVHLHPTSEVTDEMIRNIYGADIRLVRHDLHYPDHRSDDE